MNFQQKLLTATTATLVGLASTLPAQAFSFGNGGILFEQTETATFKFQRSGGWFKSIFGIVEVGPGNVLGAKTVLFSEVSRGNPGTANSDYFGTYLGGVLGAGPEKVTFTFVAGKSYSFFLDNYGAETAPGVYKQDRTVYSTTALNTKFNGSNFGQQAKFFKDSDLTKTDIEAKTVADRSQSKLATSSGGDISRATLGLGGTIGFEDVAINAPSSDRDYNDFVVSTEVPEPATMGSLALVGGAIAMYRRRKASQVS